MESPLHLLLDLALGLGTLALGLGICALIWRWDKASVEARQAGVRALIARHAATLARKREQLVNRDDYGNVKLDAWAAEVRYFLEHVVKPAFPTLSAVDYSSWIVPMIDEVVENYVRRSPSTSTLYRDVEQLDGIEYEHFCAARLRDAGWDAKVTQASGDQGVDVIASRAGIRVVLQCKKYSSPVGNKAVQEVYAAKGFENADHAVVVSNAAYTPSAKQLAAKNGVMLLHHAELDSLAHRLGL